MRCTHFKSCLGHKLCRQSIFIVYSISPGECRISILKQSTITSSPFKFTVHSRPHALFGAKWPLKLETFVSSQLSYRRWRYTTQPFHLGFQLAWRSLLWFCPLGLWATNNSLAGVQEHSLSVGSRCSQLKDAVWQQMPVLHYWVQFRIPTGDKGLYSVHDDCGKKVATYRTSSSTTKMSDQQQVDNCWK